MASKSEVGHAKNVASFHDLIAFCEGYGTIYNPSNELMKIPQLKIQKTTAQAHLNGIIPKNTAYNDEINARIITFDGLETLSTRLINSIEASGASAQKIADAKTYNNKIQGSRASKPKAVAPGETPPQTISTSQRSYDQLIQHFTGLISVLESEPNYNPNEVDLQIATLQDRLQKMIQRNDALASAYTEVSNARIQRDITLYNDETGLVAIAYAVKKYIKSIFGADSPQYKQVSGLKFRKITA